jgi:hypothetical protein
MLMLRYAAGGVGVVSASLCVKDEPPYRNFMTVRCEHGSLWRTWEPTRNPVAGAAPQMCAVLYVSSNGVTQRAEFAAHDNGGEYQWETFRHAVAHYELAEETAYHELIVNGLRVIESMTE